MGYTDASTTRTLADPRGDEMSHQDPSRVQGQTWTNRGHILSDWHRRRRPGIAAASHTCTPDGTCSPAYMSPAATKDEARTHSVPTWPGIHASQSPSVTTLEPGETSEDIVALSGCDCPSLRASLRPSRRIRASAGKSSHRRLEGQRRWTTRRRDVRSIAGRWRDSRMGPRC